MLQIQHTFVVTSKLQNYSSYTITVSAERNPQMGLLVLNLVLLILIISLTECTPFMVLVLSTFLNWVNISS